MKKLASASIIAMSLVLSGPALAQNASPLAPEIQAAVVNAGGDPVQAIAVLVQGSSQGDVADIVRALSQNFPAQADLIAATALNESSTSFLNVIGVSAVNGVQSSNLDAASKAAEIVEISAALRQRIVGQLELNPNADQGTVDIVNETLRGLNDVIAAAAGDPNTIYVAELRLDEIPVQIAQNTPQEDGEGDLETGNLANNAVNNLAQNNRSFGNVPSFVNLPSQSQASGN